MSGVVTHAGTTLMNVDALTEQQCREELKSLMAQAFGKDLLINDLKTERAKLDALLVKLVELFIAEKYSAVHDELRRMATHLQEQRAAAKAARRVH
ncbi:hypothetical protein D9M70_405710 [compost metagenome]